MNSDNPILWIAWESLDTWYSGREIPKKPSSYAIKGIIANTSSSSGNVAIEFSDFRPQGSVWPWTHAQVWMQKWGTCRRAFTLGKECLDVECLKDWCADMFQSEEASKGVDSALE